MDWDGDLDDYEYQQASMEMSGIDDTYFDYLMNSFSDEQIQPDYAPYSGIDFFEKEQGQDSPISGPECSINYNDFAECDSSSEDNIGINSKQDTNFDDKKSKKHPSHAFLPVLLEMERKILDPFTKEKYKKAIELFRENRSSNCDYDFSGGFVNYDAAYDKGTEDWIDEKGCHHSDEDFLYVDISYYKNLDSRLLILCYKYFIQTYSFVEWYKELSVAQKKYIINNLQEFDLTDIQIKVITDDFNEPPSNENISSLLIEESPDLAVKDYIISKVDGEFFDVWITYPMEGIIFKKYNKNDFDIIDLYELDDKVYSILMKNYKNKLSSKKLQEAKIRDYAKIILSFGKCKIRDSFGIEETDSKKIKAVEYLLSNKNDMFTVLGKMIKREDIYEDYINNSKFLDTLFYDLDNWYAFYTYFKKNVEGKWRQMSFDGFHKWGLIEAINVTGGKKMKYNLDGNVLTFIK